MKFLTYLFIIFQFTIVLKIYGENKNNIHRNSLEWKILEQNKFLKKKNLRWEILTGEKNLKDIIKDLQKYNFDPNEEKREIIKMSKLKPEILEIQPYIPLNEYLSYGEFNISTNWKSTFSGGAGNGTGNQNISLKLRQMLLK